MPGRRLLLDDEVQAAIVAAIASAAPLETCAAYAGVGRSTFWRWMELGKPEHGCVPTDDPEHIGAWAACPTADHAPGTCPQLARARDFRDAIERAEHALHISLAGHVVKGATRDWHAGIAVLKARWPKTWNVPQITQLQGGLEVEVTLSVRESLRAKLEELHERGLLALPSGAADDGQRPDSEEEIEHGPRHRTREPAPAEPEPEPRKRRGPAVA